MTPHVHRLVRLALRGAVRSVATVVAFTIAAASAQITRVANTSLTLPQTPQTFGYTTENAFTGLTFDQPLCIVTPPGETDRIFVLEKTGRIQVVSGLSTTPVKTLFLDLSAIVLTASEQGLLGLAFHPNFTTNHYFYVFYSLTATTSVGTGDHERVARFTAVPGATNAQILATEMPMISQFDDAPNHNGGDLHFGPDGYLYVSLGDEGGGDDQYNNSQRIDKDFFSGLLRIDVDQLPGNLTPNAHPSVHPGTYKVPADNPFVGATSFDTLPVTPANVRTEFWAVGLRNPWRFSFDAPTGRLFVGDVGQSAQEEIDLVTRGGNYGWNYREGTIAGPRANPPAGATFLDPIWATADRTLAGSITGGMVYRGSRFAQLYGQYVFGDYLQNHVFAMSFPASGPVQVQQIAVESNPVGFGVDPRNGDILMACIGTGLIKRLVYNSTATGTPLPATLTATGAFSNLATLTAAAGIVDYAPNISFWSDFAKKQRWFSVPALTDKITFSSSGNWTFPAGTVWVKHFELELTRGDPTTARRLETRFIVKTASGVYGVTYKWNTQQTEATLVPEGGADEAITINDGGIMRTQTWHYPSRSECLVCHTPVAGQALSFNTPQLNGSHTYNSGPANQLTALANAGYFTAAIPSPATLTALAPASDMSASVEYRVRSYLAANCVQCHQPGGAAQGLWDARIATPTGSAGLVNGALINSLGNSANRVIAPGDLSHSVMLARISARGLNQMPPLASNEVDAVDAGLVAAWINALRPANDFNGDARADLLWQNSTTGERSIWLMNGSTFQSGASLGDIPTDWTIAGSGDFNGDGKPDLLWQNLATGERAVWLMNGTTFVSGVSLGLIPTDWTIAGAGDFNGDGKPDIVWQNTVTGERSIWLMNGTAFVSGVSLGVMPIEWTIAAIADFNADGKPDLLWTNTRTRELSIWLMNGTNFVSGVSLGLVPAQLQVAGAGDYNGDGQPDILFSNVLTGERSIWLMHGTGVSSAVSLATVPVEWALNGPIHRRAPADFNGEGNSDLVWQNAVTGERSIWLLDGANYVSGVSLGVVPVQWSIAAVADMNGDGKPDLLWQNAATGERAIWLMNGTAFSSGVSLGVVPTEWSIADAGDLSGDGKADILWQNLTTGERVIWTMNGTAFVSGASLGFIPTDWSIAAVADFNGDGKADFLWQNGVTGERSIWLMNGTTLLSGVSLGVVPTNWSIAGTGDFNADGKIDIIWQNTVTGERSIWLMNGPTFLSGISLGVVPTQWSIKN